MSALSLTVLRERHRADDGFSLLEVMVSFVLLAIIAAGVAVALGTGTQATNATRDRTTASNVAREYIERTRALTPNTLLSTVTPDTVVVGSKTYKVTRTVTQNCVLALGTATPGLVNVSIVVTWPSNYGAGAAGTATLRSDTVLACL